MDQFVDALDTLRSAFDVEGTSAANATSVTGQSPAARISRSLERGDDVDFDLALDTVPLGSKGSKATYWIHPDHIVEAQVLLLQHMRLYINKARRNSSSRPTPLRRHSSTANMDPYVGSEDTTGLVVLDHPETFAFKQNAGTIGAAEEMQGSIGIKAAGQVRCCASSQAAVIVCDEGDAQHAPPSSVKTVKMERRYLKNFLDTSVTNDSIKHSCSPRENVLTVRQWLAEHTSAKPIAGALLKRTRFTGLHNNSAGGTWATLDKDISLTDQLFEDLGSDDWTSAAKSESTQRFPHAILEIRREGNQATSLIQMLDRSHLVCQTPIFSSELPTNKCRLSVSEASLWRHMLCGLAASQAPCLRLFGFPSWIRTFASYQSPSNDGAVRLGAVPALQYRRCLLQLHPHPILRMTASLARLRHVTRSLLQHRYMSLSTHRHCRHLGRRVASPTPTILLR